MEAVVDFLSKWAGWALGFFAAAFAIRGSVKFDVNQWLNDRRERIKQKIRRLCPHAFVTVQDEKVIFRSAFVSPFGTDRHRCQRCGVVVDDPTMLNLGAKDLADNFKEWEKLEKEIQRLIEKL